MGARWGLFITGAFDIDRQQLAKIFFVISAWKRLRNGLCVLFVTPSVVRLRLKCDGTRSETRFGLSAKRTSPFKSAGASVQSTAGSRGVCISGRNAGYTEFRGSVKRNEGDWLPTPFASFPFRASPCAITFQLDSTIWRNTLIIFKNDVVILKSFVNIVWKTEWMGKVWSICWFVLGRNFNTSTYLWGLKSEVLTAVVLRFKASGLFRIDHWMFQRVTAPLTSGWNISLVLDCLTLKIDARKVGRYLSKDMA